MNLVRLSWDTLRSPLPFANGNLLEDISLFALVNQCVYRLTYINSRQEREDLQGASTLRKKDSVKQPLVQSRRCQLSSGLK